MGVAAAEAGGTESAAVLCQFLYVFHTEVPQRVGSDDLADLFPGVMDRNEGVPGVNVRAIIAGIQEGGAEIRRCTWVAPASRSSFTMRAAVVPRTMESSMRTTRLPFTVADTGFSLIRTLFSRFF